MADKNDKYLMVTLQQLFYHGEHTVSDKAVALSHEKNLGDAKLTMAELLTHENATIRIEAEALYQEIMSFEIEKDEAQPRFRIRHIPDLAAGKSL